MDALLPALLDGLARLPGELFSHPLDPGRRLYWAFLLSSVVLALAVVMWRNHSMQLRPVLRACLDRQYWRQTSHLVDLALLGLNGFIRLTLLVPLLGSHLLATIWVARGWQSTLGNAPELNWHWSVVALLYTSVFFIAEDYSRFALHRCMHRVPFLWRMHRVHHGATVLSPLTLYRVHPLEMSVYYLRSLAVFGLVSGTFVYLFGRQLSGFDILGVDALGFLFNLLGANLRHSPVWLSFGPLERWLVSPAQHQLHHSADPLHRDINFGTCLALWDRLGGSWLPAGAPRALRFGLTEGVSTAPIKPAGLASTA